MQDQHTNNAVGSPDPAIADGATALYTNVSITARLQPIELTFYCLTAQQLDSYADEGFLLQFLLTLFGIAVGSFLGCRVALTQGSLSPKGEATLSVVGYASLCFAAIMFGLSVYYCIRQRKAKQGWFGNQVTLES